MIVHRNLQWQLVGRAIANRWNHRISLNHMRGSNSETLSGLRTANLMAKDLQ